MSIKPLPDLKKPLKLPFKHKKQSFLKETAGQKLAPKTSSFKVEYFDVGSRSLSLSSIRALVKGMDLTLT